MQKSNGHVCFYNGFEYVRDSEGILYRSSLTNGIGVNGYRLGLRFEAMPIPSQYMIERMRQNGAEFPDEQAA